MKLVEMPKISIIIPTYNREYKLIRLINSILQSDYPLDKLEIIIIDDASTNNINYIEDIFPRTKIIRNKKELLLAGSRNVGIINSTGDLIFLIDDDNVVANDTIRELMTVFRSGENSDIGIVQPIMCYFSRPNIIWCAGVERSMITSLTKFIEQNSVHNGQFKKLIESKDSPNAFMINRKVLKKVGLFNNDEFPIHYDEADFGERVRNMGYRIVCNPRAKVWHDIPFLEDNSIRSLHVHNEFRAYYAAKNRILFHRKYSKKSQFFIFIMIFNWIITIYYLKIILLSEIDIDKKLRISKSYTKGIIDGCKPIIKRM